MSSILQSIKVNGAVNIQGSTYTAPATGYAIVTITNNNGSSSGPTVGGKSLFLAASASLAGVIVGPSQVLSVASGVNAVGVEFINTT